jgi:hypothetical protein
VTLQSVQGLVEETVVALFAAYQIQDVKREAASAVAPTIAGRMRFDCPHPGGAVVIASTWGFFANSRPSANSSANVADPCALARDWARELANQLLGRLANRLAELGVNIEFGVVGQLSAQAEAAVPDIEEPQPLIFRIGSDTVWVWLDGGGILAEWLDVTTAPAGATAPAREGDIIFF